MLSLSTFVLISQAHICAICKVGFKLLSIALYFLENYLDQSNVSAINIEVAFWIQLHVILFHFAYVAFCSHKMYSFDY